MSTSSATHVPSTRSAAPAPGELSTRTPETEAAYLRRALWFETHTAKHLSVDNPSPKVVAAHALERRGDWSKSTWRQIKAALMFRFLAMGTPDAAEAADILRDGNQTPCASKTRRTSGRRAKTVSKDDLHAVIRAVRRSASKYGSLLATWLLLGAEIGLRPHEWCQASVVYVTPDEVGDDEQTGTTPFPYLRIRNAKGTNGRSHGDFRHMNLSRLTPEMVKMVGTFADMMADVMTSGNYKRYYAACAKLLFRINQELHRKDEHRWVQLYSPRHRFSSEAKLALGADGVAALMGHGTTKTASEHYGRRVAATGTLGPKPVAAEIARVRKIRGHQARRIDADKGSTPGQAPAGTKAVKGS